MKIRIFFKSNFDMINVKYFIKISNYVLLYYVFKNLRNRTI